MSKARRHLLPCNSQRIVEIEIKGVRPKSRLQQGISSVFQMISSKGSEESSQSKRERALRGRVVVSLSIDADVRSVFAIVSRETRGSARENRREEAARLESGRRNGRSDGADVREARRDPTRGRPLFGSRQYQIRPEIRLAAKSDNNILVVNANGRRHHHSTAGSMIGHESINASFSLKNIRKQ